MSKITSDLKYIEGLAQGKEIEKDENLGKLLSELIKSVSKLSEKVDELFNNSLLDGMDELDDLMQTYFGEVPELDDEDQDEDDFYEVTCQKCGHTYLADFEDFVDDEVVCPVCGEHYSLSDDVLKKLMESEHDHD